MVNYGEANRYRIRVSTKDLKLENWRKLSEIKLEVITPIYFSTEGFMKIANSCRKP